MSPEYMPTGAGGYNPGAGLQHRVPRVKRALACPACGNTKLAVLQCGEFSAEQNVMIGTPLQTINDEPPYYLYLCLKCLQPVEQPLTFMGVDPARQIHNEILEMLRAHSQKKEQDLNPADD